MTEPVEAGPELDVLIAQAAGLIVGPIVEIVGGKAVNAAGGSILLPPYSTDDSAALELVPVVLRDWDSDNDKEGGFEAEFGAWYQPDWWEKNQTNRGPRWWAAFGAEYDQEGRHWLYQESASELAHAICLAVRAAMKDKEAS